MNSTSRQLDQRGEDPAAQAAEPLFRLQAIAGQRQRLWGEVVLVQPLTTRLLTWLLLIAVTTILIYLCLGRYERKERVSGYIKPVGGAVRVVAPMSGILTDVLARDGQTVTAGDRLARVESNDWIDAGIAGHDAQTPGDETVSRFAFQVARLEASMARETEQLLLKESEFALQAEQTDREVAGLEQKLAQLQVRRVLARQRTVLMEKAVARSRLLAQQGHAPRLLYEQKHDELLRHRDAILVLQNERAALRQAIEKLQYRSRQIPLQLRQAQVHSQRQIQELSRQLAQTTSQRSRWITAPRSGRIQAVNLQAGQALRLDQPLLVILPSDFNATAELLVPARASGFLRIGQEVRLRYDAFPFQRYGSHPGEVVGIDMTVVQPHEIQVPTVVQEPVYRLTVSPRSNSVTAHGEQHSLRSGMTLSADIVLEERSLLQWLFDPLLSLRGSW